MEILFHNPPISANYFENISTIELSDEYLEEVPTWIRLCINLQSLVLHNNSITDLNNLGHISPLKRLEIDNNCLDNLYVLRQYHNLEYLSVHNNDDLWDDLGYAKWDLEAIKRNNPKIYIM